MFHKATQLAFKEGTLLELTFQTGEVMEYDMSSLFEKYPQLKALEERTLFTSGRLAGSYGIIWNDNLDIEAETIYQDGKIIRHENMPVNIRVANAISIARNDAGLSQTELSYSTGIDQSDISRIERGLANPSIMTLERIANALGKKVDIVFTENLP